MNYALTFLPESVGNFYTISLPWSKSVLNRQLIIEFLTQYFGTRDDESLLCCDTPRCTLEDAASSLSDDVYQLRGPLKTLLSSSPGPKNYTFNIHGAGTAMRFLTAICALIPCAVHLSGDARMCERPIAPLVDALRPLGCAIEYEGQAPKSSATDSTKKAYKAPVRVGYPPLLIKGGALRCTAPIFLSSSTSSQFVSALLLIAPYIQGGLELHLVGEVVSKPYITLTLALMKRCGAKVETGFKASRPFIKVAAVPYTLSHSGEAHPFLPERDWSSASYFLALAFLLHKKWGKHSTVFFFNALQRDSLQGDRGQMELFKQLGACFEFTAEGLHFGFKSSSTEAFQGSDVFTSSFKAMPDLLPTFVVLCLMIDRPFCFTGVKNLRLKECDRLKALRLECKKMGYVLEEEEDVISWQGRRCASEEAPCFETYNDHRMAMSLALFSLDRSCTIKQAEVVKKSCPNFWTIFEQVVRIKVL